MENETSPYFDLGYEIRLHRESQNLSQTDLADALSSSVTRQIITHLENGKRLPSFNVVEEICSFLKVPKVKWEVFFVEKFRKRREFEALFSELVGFPLDASGLDPTAVRALEDAIDGLIPNTLSVDNSFDALNTVLIYYGVQPLSHPFFEYYLKDALTDKLSDLGNAVSQFHKDAIRLFSTFSEAYKALNRASRKEFDQLLGPLAEESTDKLSARDAWNKIDKIPNEDLPYLGYIAAAQVRETQKKRKELSEFLRLLATAKRNNNLNMDDYSTAKKRRMDSFLREFDSKLEHTLSSPLFISTIDPETIEREADRVSPKEEDVKKIEETQRRAYANLCNYLAADYLDVYVATSMRNDADFVSVNDFVENLFRKDGPIGNLNLRYFNPTQSWIADRVAKGLVEALMLKRADICIYMAQKSDTFGKDSEASVTLGQGKAVIVYVPKLSDPDIGIDTETFGSMSRAQLLGEIAKLDAEEVDEDEDNEALIGRLLKLKFRQCDDADLVRIVNNHWADFDLEGEFAERTKENPTALQELRAWLRSILAKGKPRELLPDLKDIVTQALIGRALRFESRATVFREVHPLALQIILSNRVINGILVARSSESCARLVKKILQNKLETELKNEPDNYKLVEKETGSIIRVISKHKLISNSFETFYRL
ncbi:MAG: helix-turn-helix transcriptional regulator [Acidobacteria bacterium]|nr:helix-turn-helix transcriptional regulator [Acidobacteriota bacterium]